jgi:hypothetical protein
LSTILEVKSNGWNYAIKAVAVLMAADNQKLASGLTRPTYADNYSKQWQMLGCYYATPLHIYWDLCNLYSVEYGKWQAQ